MSVRRKRGDGVIVHLVDFIAKEEIEVLDLWLKCKFRSPISIPFSLEFKNQTIKKGQSSGSLLNCFDVVISVDHNAIIMGGSKCIHIFDYITKKYSKTIPIDVEVHELEIDKSGLHLYITGEWNDDCCFAVGKYDLANLLKHGDATHIWKSDVINGFDNVWGLGLFQLDNETFCYAMDYGIGLVVFDSKTGERVHHTVPHISNGYGVAFTPENEMIVTSAYSHASPVEIYTFDKDLKKWNLKLNCLRIEGDSTPYGVFYESKTQRIFVADTISKSITVFSKNNLNREKKYQFPTDFSTSFYGILIDEKTGILYLPDVSGNLLTLE